MREKELQISDIPGDYLSKEDFYKIAHISKRTALWLIETELIFAEKPERQGLGYRIPKAEVERYLADRNVNPTKYRRSNRCIRYPYSPVQRYSKQLGIEIRAIVEHDMISKYLKRRSQPHRQDRLSAETTMVPSMSRLTAPAMCRRLAM